MLNVLYSLPSPSSTVPSVSTPSTSHTNNLTRASRAASDFSISAVGSVELDQVREQFRHFSEWNHIGAITQGAIRIGVRFNEDSISPGHDRAARQHRSEFALAAGLVAPAAGH